MEYRIIRHDQNDDYVEHGILKDTARKAYNYANSRGGRLGRAAGWVKEKHDYLARANIGGKWRYAYTPEQVKAMVNWGKGRIKKAGEVISGRYATDVDRREKQGKRHVDAAARQRERARASYASGNANQGHLETNSAREHHKKGHDLLNETKKEKQSFAYKISNLSNVMQKNMRDLSDNALSAGRSAVKNALEVARGAKSFGSTKLSDAKEYARKGRELLTTYTEKAKGIAEDPKDWVQTKAENARRSAGEAAGRVLTKAGLQDEYDAAKKKAGEIAGSVKTKATDIRDKAKGIAEDPVDWAKTKAERAGERISNSKVGDAWNYVKPGGTLDQKATNVAKNAYGAAKGAYTSAKEFTTPYASAAARKVTDLADAVEKFSRNAYRNATDSDYRALNKQANNADKELDKIEDRMAELRGNGETGSPEYNELQQSRSDLMRVLQEADAALAAYDEED